MNMKTNILPRSASASNSWASRARVSRLTHSTEYSTRSNICTDDKLHARDSYLKWIMHISQQSAFHFLCGNKNLEFVNIYEGKKKILPCCTAQPFAESTRTKHDAASKNQIGSCWLLAESIASKSHVHFEQQIVQSGELNQHLVDRVSAAQREIEDQGEAL